MSDVKRFSLIEALIVLLIIVVIGVIAAFAVNSSRSQTRDAVRLSNVRQMQIVLEEYFNEENTYPLGRGLPLGDASQSSCLGGGGFKANCTSDDSIFLRVIPPTFPKGLDDLVTCGTPARNAFCYDQLLDGEGYSIEFELENTLAEANLQKGVNCATPTQIKAGACR